MKKSTILVLFVAVFIHAAIHYWSVLGLVDMAFTHPDDINNTVRTILQIVAIATALPLFPLTISIALPLLSASLAGYMAMTLMNSSIAIGLVYWIPKAKRKKETAKMSNKAL